MVVVMDAALTQRFSRILVGESVAFVVRKISMQIDKLVW
jgi:hypothetical protein